jgi:hypothetical protein
MKVYYDTETHGFRTIRGQAESGFSVSKPCDYYDDAKTTFCTMVISGKYIDRNFVDPEPMRS